MTTSLIANGYSTIGRRWQCGYHRLVRSSLEASRRKGRVGLR
jgi:hypothetical protein